MAKKLSAIFLCICLLCTFSVVLTSAAPVIYDEDLFAPEPTWPGISNLVPGGDFETGEAIFSNGWSADNGEDYISFVDDAERGGKVVKIENASDPATRTYFSYKIDDVIPGVTYQATVKIKTEALTGPASDTAVNSPRLVAEYYTQTGGWNSMLNGPAIGSTEGEWANVMQQFTPPPGTYRLAFYLCFEGTGIAYYDDAEIKPIGNVVTGKVQNQCIIYSDWVTTDVDITLYNPTIKTVSFSVSDGDTVLFSEDKEAKGKTVSFTYPVSILKETGHTKGYILKVDYKDANGASVGTPYTDEIYRYDRPSALTADGLYIHPTTGEPIKPVVGYVTWYEDLEFMQSVGVNVGTLEFKDCFGGKPDQMSIERMLDYLDTAWYEYGFLTNVVLYEGGKRTAADPTLIENTIEVVKALKDHPGLYGWMIYDEPFSVGKLEKLSYEETVAQLKLAYKTIRDLDPVHPVMLCEATTSGAYDAARIVDVLAVDPYPKSNPMALHCYNFIAECREITDNLKPILNLMQAWSYGGWEPGPNDIRHMAYQGLFAGCEATGYYTVSAAWYKKPVWERLCGPGVKALAEGEYEDAYKAFITGEYPTFNQKSGNPSSPYWYKSYVKDGELYMVIMNTSDADAKVNINLTSWDEKISIGSFTATAADISDFADVKGDGKLSFTMKGNAVHRVKITPDTAVDYSSLTGSLYNDLTKHGWAKADIDALANKGILNSTSLRKYEPGKAITRADFAMFLVKTLGLTADATENFVDVPAFAPFAEALAIGKALGILNGVGDNKYNPYAEITRQDLMVITSRALKLAEGADVSTLAAFSDNASIAEYAKADVAAMVAAGMVKGNADGTINPLGNTTRAETAVIMSRIDAAK